MNLGKQAPGPPMTLGTQMVDIPAKLAEHYRKLASEELAMAKAALTNEARARRRLPIIGSWRTQRRTSHFTPTQVRGNYGSRRIDVWPHWKERPEMRMKL